MLIGNANASNFLHNIDKVMGNNVVHDELSLIPEIYCLEILRFGLTRRQHITRACPSCWFKPVVLESNEPGESEQVGDDNVGTHHFKHAFLAL